MNKKYFIPLLLAAASFQQLNAAEMMSPMLERVSSSLSVDFLYRAAKKIKHFWKKMPIEVKSLLVVAAAYFSLAVALVLLIFFLFESFYDKVLDTASLPFRLIAGGLEALGVPPSASTSLSIFIVFVLFLVAAYGLFKYVEVGMQREREEKELLPRIRGFLSDDAKIRKPLGEQKKVAEMCFVGSVVVFMLFCAFGAVFGKGGDGALVPLSDAEAQIQIRQLDNLRDRANRLSQSVNNLSEDRGESIGSFNNVRLASASDADIFHASNYLQRQLSLAEKGNSISIDSSLHIGDVAPIIVSNSTTSHVDIDESEEEKEFLDEDSDENEETTALHIAAERGQQELVKVLIEKGLEIDAKDQFERTALHRTAKAGHREVVKDLLGKGADPNVQDQNGQTALHIAAASGHREVVKDLLEKGADPNAKNRWGSTALHIAARAGQREMVKLLLGKGADPNAKDEDGKTALHYAIEKGQQEMAKDLLEKGADPNAKNKYGKTPLNIAEKKGIKLK